MATILKLEQRQSNSPSTVTTISIPSAISTNRPMIDVHVENRGGTVPHQRRRANPPVKRDGFSLNVDPSNAPPVTTLRR